MDTPTRTIRLLERGDGLDAFDCGHEALNTFLKRYAGQNQRRDAQRTYVVAEQERILAFMTVAAGEWRRDDPGDIERGDRPVLRLLRLGTELTARGQGLAASLLRYAFELALGLAQTVGCIGIIVDAKPEAITFYDRLGFAPLGEVAGDGSLPMFLHIKTIRSVIEL